METKQTYYLQIADNALILSHRLSEYSSHGPYLEEDLATTNVALDLIGIAESVYIETARISDEGKSADDLVYRRGEFEYLNCLLVEQPNTDFAYIMVRQFFTDAFHFYFFTELVNSSDPFMAELGIKSIKEIAYHLRRSSEWMVRLGDGTEEAHQKTQDAINSLWRFTGEFFEENETDKEMRLTNAGADLFLVYKNWLAKINEIFYMSNLKVPDNKFQLSGGKNGRHTEHMGFILTEMQFLPSKYPDAIW
jgi:ring-1,2-phenylacetyl-CoA epoxidase subunit PaaC